MNFVEEKEGRMRDSIRRGLSFSYGEIYILYYAETDYETEKLRKYGKIMGIIEN